MTKWGKHHVILTEVYKHRDWFLVRDILPEVKGWQHGAIKSNDIQGCLNKYHFAFETKKVYEHGTLLMYRLL